MQHFAAQFSRENIRRPPRFAPAAFEALAQARWRGNIRELRNVIERLLVMTDREVIDGDDVRAVTRSVPRPVAAPAVGIAPASRATTLREFKETAERDFLVGKLREFDWNISRTAEVIDTPRSNCIFEQYGIKPETDS